MFLKVLGLAAPIVGGGVFLAGGFDAAGGGGATPHAARAGTPAISAVGPAAAGAEPNLAACVEIGEKAMSEADAMGGRGNPQAAARLLAMRGEMRDAGCDPQGLLKAFDETFARQDDMIRAAAGMAGDMEAAAADIDAAEIRPGEPMIDVSR